MSIIDGGPAYPANETHGLNSGTPGLTLRDYFAAAALTGALANLESNVGPSHLSNLAYRQADEMLKAREVPASTPK